MAGHPNPDLFGAFVSALPFNFLAALRNDLPQIYREAHEHFAQDPLLEGPDAGAVIPHYRRALFETRFRRAAAEAGLEASVRDNSRRTSQYSIVRSGNFVMTASYVNERSSTVRAAEFRSDFAGLNKLLSQMSFEGMEAEDESRQMDGETIYCILLHGPNPDDKTQPGFMTWAFPHHTSKGWVAEYEFVDVYEAAEQKQKLVQKDGAIPTLKNKNKKGGDGGGGL